MPVVISPAIKDKILKYLCTDCELEVLSQGSTNEVLKELEISIDESYPVMNQFQRLGFIESLNLRRSHVSFVLLTEAQDFHFRGGFHVQEEVFEENINRLMLELDLLKKQLTPDLLERAEKIGALASTALEAVTLVKNK